jgi:hypothetical protein
MLKTELLEIIASGENSGVEFKRDDLRGKIWAMASGENASALPARCTARSDRERSCPPGLDAQP